MNQDSIACARTGIEQILEKNDLTLSDFLAAVDFDNSSLLRLGKCQQDNFIKIYNEIIKLKGKSSQRTKGKLLEDLVSIIFDVNLLEQARNIRTATNEIDMLLVWSEIARTSNIDHRFPCFGESFLCECKNYNKKVDVTYVGKFYSLLKVSGAKFGVMVAWEGITGRGKWIDAHGLTKKIALKDNVYIVILDRKDLKLIYDEKINIFSLLNKKYIELKNDVDFSKDITSHEQEERFELKFDLENPCSNK